MILSLLSIQTTYTLSICKDKKTYQKNDHKRIRANRTKIETRIFNGKETHPEHGKSLSNMVITTWNLLGGRHKEGRSRGTDRDPASLKH